MAKQIKDIRQETGERFTQVNIEIVEERQEMTERLQEENIEISQDFEQFRSEVITQQVNMSSNVAIRLKPKKLIPKVIESVVERRARA